MKFALIGYGKMGRAIESAATARGHVCAAIVDRKARGRRIVRTIEAAPWSGVKVAFEFTEPTAAKDHVIALLGRGVGVVCGTTGWDAADPTVRRAARSSSSGAVIAPNFSVGVNLFYSIVDAAARCYLAVQAFDPWIAEWHHGAKVDAPSGTARRLAAILSAATPARGSIRGDVPLAALRVGHASGRHVVGFDGPHDAVTLEHVARGREGFAEGAVLAAEWLLGRRGLHGFEDVLQGRLRGRRRKGERR